jgi:hypothetical protein
MGERTIAPRTCSRTGGKCANTAIRSARLAFGGSRTAACLGGCRKAAEDGEIRQRCLVVVSGPHGPLQPT